MPGLAPPTPAAAPVRLGASPGPRNPRTQRFRRKYGGFYAQLLLAAALGLPPPAHAADAAQPGAYCPLPEPGQVPACLDPAKQAYGEFFEALDAGELHDAPLAGVEDAVARGADAEEAYLALSSLTYGYYRLAQRTAAAENADPVVVERLARWNGLLASAYRENASDAAYRASVERAARELRDRAPVLLPCRDAEGGEAACTSTEAVIRGFNATTEEVGMRGALERLLRRLFGGSE